jgi:drug/metabolite transporter (DMT)-like permease
LVRISDSKIGPAALLGSAIIWGFVPVTTRHVLETLAPRHVILARFLFASLTVVIVLSLLRPALPPRRHIPRAVVFGLLGTLCFNVPLTFGLQHVTAGTAALLNATSPVFTVVLASILLDEELRPRMVAGLSLALLGSVVVAAGSGGEFGVGGEQLWGCALVLLAGIVWAIYSVTVKPWLGPIPPSSIPMIGSLAGLPLVLPFGVVGFVAGLERLDTVGWISLLQFAVGASIIAPILFAIGLQRSKASRAGMYGYLTPLFGVVAGAALLGERIGPATIAGGTMILGGVVVATLAPRAPPRPATAGSPLN